MITDQIFLGASQKRLMRRGVPVLMYHYFGPPDPKTHDPYLYVSSRRLDAECSALRSHGYSTATLSGLAASCRSGESMPHKVVITIDDGARDFHEGGMKILNEHGFQAIQFLVADRIGGINDWDVKHGHPALPLMDDGQIREWLAEGHEIGSHSMTHPNLSMLGEAEARRQIVDSKKSLEDRFGVPIRHFCYPHGKFNAMAEALVEEAGYETASSTRFGVNGPGQNLMAIQRISTLSTKDLLGKVCHRLCRKLKLHK